MTDYESMIISALRYALNRRSYIMSVTDEYITGMLEKEDPTRHFLEVAIEDIEDCLKEQGGRKPSYDWRPLLGRIKSKLTA